MINSCSCEPNPNATSTAVQQLPRFVTSSAVLLTTEPSASTSVASKMLSAVAPYTRHSRDQPPLSASPPTPTTLHTPMGAASLEGRTGGGGV